VDAFTLGDYAALAGFLAAWLGYNFAVENTKVAGRSLNLMMDAYRADWTMHMLSRENRIVDTSIIATLQNGTAFFASTSLLAIGGTLALLRSTDEVLTLVSDLPLGLRTLRVAWEMKVVGLVVIFGYAFFKFSWSYRLFNYAAILIGAVPPPARKDEPETQKAVSRAAAMNVVAGRHFNRGQRAFFFALAYLGWFISPYVLFASTTAVLIVMWRRQFSSDSRRALEDNA
jgi:uncharacterized membrane protein